MIQLRFFITIFFFLHSFHFIFTLRFLLSDMPGRKNCAVAYANVRGPTWLIWVLWWLLVGVMLWSVRRLWSPLGDTQQSCESPGTHIMVWRVWTAGLLLEVCQFMSARVTLVFASLAMNVVVTSSSVWGFVPNKWTFMCMQYIATLVLMTLCWIAAHCYVWSQQTDRKPSFVFVGDFNAHHRYWLGSVSQTSDCWTLLPVVLASN